MRKVPYFLRYCNNTTTTQTKMGIAKEEVEIAGEKKTRPLIEEISKVLFNVVQSQAKSTKI